MPDFTPLRLSSFTRGGSSLMVCAECTKRGKASSSWCRPSRPTPFDPCRKVNVPYSWTSKPRTTTGPWAKAGAWKQKMAARMTN